MKEVALAGADVIVVGGGIAGLSAAALLAERRRVLLLEREPRFASQASGHNAAIFRPIEHDACSARLARRSRQLLLELIGPEVLQPTGLLLVSEQLQPIAALAQIAVAENVPHELLRGQALWQRAPSLAGGQAQHGLCLLDGGVLDLPLLTTRLEQLARTRGAELRTGVGVVRVTLAAGRVTGVECSDGTPLCAQHVVFAAGAWSAQLAAASGTQLPLTPQRRHLVQLTAASSLASEPVVWRLDDEVYYRAAGLGLLASPCDEAPWPAEQPASDPSALRALAQKLERTAPGLASGQVQRAWACLRTFAPDRELVVGGDARIAGLHWLAGLGGRGMSTALAAAELLAAELFGHATPVQEAKLAAKRFA